MKIFVFLGELKKAVTKTLVVVALEFDEQQCGTKRCSEWQAFAWPLSLRRSAFRHTEAARSDGGAEGKGKPMELKNGCP